MQHSDALVGDVSFACDRIAQGKGWHQRRLEFGEWRSGRASEDKASGRARLGAEESSVGQGQVGHKVLHAVKSVTCAGGMVLPAMVDLEGI